MNFKSPNLSHSSPCKSGQFLKFPGCFLMSSHDWGFWSSIGSFSLEGKCMCFFSAPILFQSFPNIWSPALPQSFYAAFLSGVWTLQFLCCHFHRLFSFFLYPKYGLFQKRCRLWFLVFFMFFSLVSSPTLYTLELQLCVCRIKAPTSLLVTGAASPTSFRHSLFACCIF